MENMKHREKKYAAFLGMLKLRRNEVAKGNKKLRTHKNEFQKTFLKDVFGLAKFPSSETREELALILNHSSRSIQIWFQNRRYKTAYDNTDAIKRTINKGCMCEILKKNLPNNLQILWKSFIE